MLTVDACGLSCPQPVIVAKQAIEANPGEDIEVIVDDMVARENLLRLAENVGYTATVNERADETFAVLMKKNGELE